MDMVAIGRVVLTNREYMIALEPVDKALVETLLRYPYEVRNPTEYFDDIQDVKIEMDMLDLAKDIVAQKTAEFDPSKFEDRYENALIAMINEKRAGRPIQQQKRPAGENVVDLMDALKRSLGGKSVMLATMKKGKPKKAAPGLREMLLPIRGSITAAAKKRFRSRRHAAQVPDRDASLSSIRYQSV